MTDISTTRTFNRGALQRRVGAMKIGDEFCVDSEAEKKVAWECGSHLAGAGKIKFRVKTEGTMDGRYRVRAVKP